MKDNFEQCFALMLKSEGGYTNNPRDPGGMTNLGVTHIDWAKWAGHEPTESEMRSLTPQMVMPLYKAWYWDKICGDDLPYGVDYAVYDYGVNSGIGRSAKTLQNIIGVDADGMIGPKTLAALDKEYPSTVVQEICDRRLAFLQSLPTWETFGKGWGTRVKSVERIALDMVSTHR